MLPFAFRNLSSMRRHYRNQISVANPLPVASGSEPRGFLPASLKADFFETIKMPLSWTARTAFPEGAYQ
jgi:hypothetical protein